MLQGAPVTLLRAACEDIALWALTTAMTNDLTHRREGRNVPVHTYPELYAAQRVLPKTFVWIGAMDAGNTGHGRNGWSMAYLGDDEEMTTTWFAILAIGHLTALVLRVQSENRDTIQIGSVVADAFRSIWPAPEAISWPPPKILARDEFERLWIKVVGGDLFVAP
jgi:hypothetical protein